MFFSLTTQNTVTNAFAGMNKTHIKKVENSIAKR
jgi:hypothetical protein